MACDVAAVQHSQVFAISAIGNFSAAARAGLLADASALLGGDLEVRLSQRPVSAEQLMQLREPNKLWI